MLLCSHNRAAIILHLLRDKKNGLGAVFPEDLLDLESFFEGAEDHERLIEGPDGLEAIDRCDLLVNEQQSGWDLIKTLLFEGRAIIEPGATFRYKVEKARAPSYAFQFPGNVIASTIVTQKGVERRVNTIRGNYADQADNYKLRPFVHKGDLGGDAERVEQISFISLTRKSNVAREARFRLQKAQTALRYTLKTPPIDGPDLLDSARLSYDTPNSRRGFSGFVQGASSVSEIVLDRTVKIEAGVWEIQIFHKQSQTTELRTLANSAGEYAIALPAAPFEEIFPGDLWAIGKQNVHIQEVLIEGKEIDADGQIEWQCSRYDPTIYDLDEAGEPQLDPPPDINPVLGADSQSPPPPIIAAQAVEVPENGTVSWRFNIAPGYSPLSREAQAVTALSVTLHSDEPAIDEFFTTASITIGGQTRTVVSYDGTTRVAVLSAALSPVPDPGPYTVVFAERAPTAGFLVEKSADAEAWETLVSGAGFELLVEGQEPDYEGYFRFTPRSVHGHENTRGRWVVQLSEGDSEAPAAPEAVTLSSFEKAVQVNVDLLAPVSRDTEKIIVECRRGAADGALISTATLGVVRNDTLSGTTRFHYLTEVSEEEFGTVIFARAQVVDYFGNASAFTDSALGTTLTEVEDEGEAPEADLMNYAHEWSDVREYRKNDVVIFLGETYIALEPNTDIEPPSDPYAWQILGVHEGGALAEPIDHDELVNVTPDQHHHQAHDSSDHLDSYDPAGTAAAAVAAHEAAANPHPQYAGGGGEWELADSWTHSANVSEVIFTGLGNYSEILVFINAVTATDITLRLLRVSSDNGSTFHATSGDYIAINTSGATTNQTEISPHTTASTAARTAWARIMGWNLAQEKLVHGSNLTTTGTYVINVAAALNALRVFVLNGSMTGGSIKVFGRR